MERYKLYLTTDVDPEKRYYYREDQDYTEDEEQADVLGRGDLAWAILTLRVSEIPAMGIWQTKSFNILRVS